MRQMSSTGLNILTRYWLYVAIFSLGGLKVFSQNEPIEVTETYILKAQEFAGQGQNDSASIYYQKLAEVYLAQNQLVDYIFSYIDAAYLFTGARQFGEATNLLTKALQPLQAPADQDEQWAFLWLYIHLGHNLHQMGNYLDAKESYEAALLKYVGEEHRDFDVANHLYRPLGNIYTRLGAHEQAFKLLDRFREISMEWQYINVAAEALSDIGILFFDQRRYQDAVTSYLKALDLPINNKAKALVLSNLAGAYLELNQFDEAINSSKEAHRLFTGINMSHDSREILAYQSGVQHKLAHAYLAQKKFKLAQNHFEQALELSLAAYGSQNRRETAKIYLGLGELYLELQEPDQALSLYQKTLQIILPYLSDNPEENPAPSNLYAENSLMEALQGKASAYRQKYFQEKDIEMVKQALNCYDLIFRVEAELRQNYQFESSKLFQVNESHQRSEHALELAYQLFTKEPTQINFDQALQISESARSVVLKESLQDYKAQNFAGIPDSVHTFEKDLKINLSLLRKDLLQNQAADHDSLEIKAQKEQIFQLEQQQIQLVAHLESQYPAYYRLKYQTQIPITAEEIRSELFKDNDVVIEYFVGQQSIYILKITADALDFIKVANDFNLLGQGTITSDCYSRIPIHQNRQL